MTNPPNLLSADKPLSDPACDHLGYAPFAKHLADSICAMAPAEGFVIAVYGPWGSGKTTLLNFVLHYLKQTEPDEQPVVVSFNPWWFSGHEDLVKHFLDQLQAVFRKHHAVAVELATRLADLADALSETPIPYASTGKAVARVVRPRNKNVPELKEKIAETLKQQNRRVLVIVDDLDRLTAEEIRQLFRAIKAVADFPNVIYLLAFDKSVAIRALEEAQGIPGEDYLEKIVQVPFELPLPDKISLRQLLFDRLEHLLAGTPDYLFDRAYWANVYFEGIDPFVTTPRDAVRLVNSLAVTYSAVKGEVHFVDFVAIEALRIFSPQVYDAIRQNPDRFAGPSDSAKGLQQVPDMKAFYDALLPEKDGQPIKKLLLRLFPKLEAVWGKMDYNSYWSREWRRDRRVCSPDVLPVYFHLAVPEGDISNIEMRASLALVADPQAFGARLVELANQVSRNGISKARAFLERLEDYTEAEILPEQMPSIVEALFNVGDELLRPEDERRGMLDPWGNDMRIARIVHQLLRRIEEPSRFSILRKAMLEGRSVFMVVYELGLDAPTDDSPADQPHETIADALITLEHYEELKRIALDKIRRAATERLLQLPGLPGILYSWHNWAGEDEVKQWVQQIIADDQGLAEFIAKFPKQVFVQSWGDVTSRTHYYLDPEQLKPLLEPDEIIDRARRLAVENRLEENQRGALRQFVRGYELRQAGKDPSSPLAWRDQG